MSNRSQRPGATAHAVLQIGSACIAALLLVPIPCARAVTVEDFGYNNMATPSSLSTLVVLVHFSDEPAIAPADVTHWNDFVFDPSRTPLGVNAFFDDMSTGSFALSPGETLVISEHATNRLGEVTDRMADGYGQQWYFSNLVHKTMLEASNFQQYDADVSGTVTPDELLIIFLAQNAGGGVRPAGTVEPSGLGVAWSGRVAISSMSESVGGVAVMAHELSHLFGAYDLYGVWGTDQDMNTDLSLMSGECHHDAWHKMQFGWVQPRVRSADSDGTVTLYAPHERSTDAPVILYDPDVGTNEFFLLEYRTRTRTTGSISPHEATVAGNGLVIWHVYHDAHHRLVQYNEAAYPMSEDDWFECECEALVKKSAIGDRPCASTNDFHVHRSHNTVDDPYALEYGVSSDPLERLVKCNKCGGLFFKDFQATSHCPDGGTHFFSGTPTYYIPRNQPGPVGHNRWRRCTECQSLFFGPRWDTSSCPGWAGGVHIAGPLADEYTVVACWAHPTLMARSAPDLMLGENEVWGSDAWTPHLTWYDGSGSRIRLHVHPFTAGADTIQVSWIVSSIWVDLGYSGVEEGTYNRPFNTMAEGLAAAVNGATVYVRGQGSETPTVNQRVRIESYEGRARIGE